MDNKLKPSSPRMAKRKKWLRDKRQLSKLRITRARSSDITSEKRVKQHETIETVSERGFKTKFNVSAHNKTTKKSIKISQKKVKRKQNDNDTNLNVLKKDMNTNNKAKVKPMNEEKIEEKNKSKKAKTETTDAVHKLENSTSVHIPKRFVLFVGNLPDNVTKEQIEEHFRKTGGVKSIRIPRDQVTDQNKGFAYVEFNNTISHRIALRLHNTTLGGHKIIVEFTSNGKVTKKQLESIKERSAFNKETLTPLKMPFDT